MARMQGRRIFFLIYLTAISSKGLNFCHLITEEETDVSFYSFGFRLYKPSYIGRSATPYVLERREVIYFANNISIYVCFFLFPPHLFHFTFLQSSDYLYTFLK